MRIAFAKRYAGFTLVELLIVIVGIGLLTTLAVPLLGRASDSAARARDLENARSVASMAQSAEAAGATVIDPEGNVIETIRTLARGVTPEKGAFAGETYRVPISEGDIPGAARFLRIENGLLVYSPKG